MFEYTTDNWKEEYKNEKKTFFPFEAEEEKKEQREETDSDNNNNNAPSTMNTVPLLAVNTTTDVTDNSNDAPPVVTPHAESVDTSMSSLSISMSSDLAASASKKRQEQNQEEREEEEEEEQDYSYLYDHPHIQAANEEIAKYRIALLELRTEGMQKRNAYKQKEIDLCLKLDDLNSKWEDKQLHVHACNLEDVVLERFRLEMDDRVRWFEKVVQNVKEEGIVLEKQLRYDVESLEHRMIECSEKVAWLMNDIIQLDLKIQRLIKQQKRLKQKQLEEEQEQKRLIQLQLEELYRQEIEQLEQNTKRRQQEQEQQQEE